MSMDFPSSPVNGQTTTDGRYYFDSSVGSSGAWRSTPLPVGGLPAGSIMAWGTNTPPANWLIADGSAVSRSVYSSLFAVIGTQYGAGNGTTTFNLPDLRGRVPVGRNGGTFGTLGATGGAETHALTVNEMPSHNHGGSTSTNGSHSHSSSSGTSFVTDTGAGVSVTTAAGGSFAFKVNGAFTALNGDHSHTISAQGGGQAHNNLQPYQVVNYIIKASAGWTAGDSELATRVGAIETADATTNRAGLVPVVPTSVTVGSGSASVGANGLVTFTAADNINLVGIFSSTYSLYEIRFHALNTTAGPNDPVYAWFTNAGSNITGVYGASHYVDYNGGAGVGYIRNNASNAVIGVAGTSGLTQSNIQVSWTTGGGFKNFKYSNYNLNNAQHLVGGYNIGAAVADGFRVTPNTGTSRLTGTIQVYGYR